MPEVPGAPSRYIVTATMDDVPHLSKEAQDSVLDAAAAYQREARRTGVPSLGSGAIFPIDERDITVADFQIPAHYPRGYALDSGWNWTAALWGARNLETDVVYVYDAYKRGQAEPPSHAEAIKGRGAWIPGVGDCADINRYDGVQFLQIYRTLGLVLDLPDKRSVEANIHEVYVRLTTGRLKFFKSLAILFDEFRVYRRDENGKIVRDNDHLMACLQYLCKSCVRLMKTRAECEFRPAFYGPSNNRSAWT
jgi:hypothetical protein